ncbi:hypothetical protein H4R23_004338 [Coemansia sp. Cherry 401B]|nr:hypothetical protein H4S01_003036 [Coemansia sp. RSA 2610]KAJ2723700.1 hypothetical protein H4R23_004338 [Coemansia sp. Cherry 401B]
MRATLPLSLAVLAVAAYALPAPEPLLGLIALVDNKITGLDKEAACLSPTANALSDDSRQSLNSLATSLQLSLFRNIRQFAPAAEALGLASIQSDILSDDYSTSVVALRKLQSYFETNIPEVKNEIAASSSASSESAEETAEETGAASSPATCDAPTAKNLRIIYADLIKLVQQF